MRMLLFFFKNYDDKTRVSLNHVNKQKNTDLRMLFDSTDECFHLKFIEIHFIHTKSLFNMTFTSKLCDLHLNHTI